ncbi:MAG: hypothetical protein JXR44_02490 [Thiotrichales bacterium]|nr:hypothetical protein [Thiotrichales bacterium]
MSFLKKAGFFASVSLMLTACHGDNRSENPAKALDTNLDAHPSALVGSYINPLMFDKNPYPQIPAQCYTETSLGRQNSCLYCHTNGLYELGVGNNNPQAGAIPMVNFQIDYGFDPYSTQAPTAAKNYWENTLYPEKLQQAVAALNLDPQAWRMAEYWQEDNWSPAYQQRLGKSTDWDTGINHPMRLLPGLNPKALPADSDGFVRSNDSKDLYFQDALGGNTGWRSVNFMPYGIFTPQTGSVSGIYLRLPAIFMQNRQGQFDLATYDANLNLLKTAIQNRLTDSSPKFYLGMAHRVAVQAGVYPQGTELAHPLHYVDPKADGKQSTFPGMRAQRVKEIRYMYKDEDVNPMQARPGDGSGDQIYGNDEQGWVDNGAGWIIAGFIEDQQGELRPQTRAELTQCIGCHSGFHFATKDPNFTSGTGNSVDSTWALPRAFEGQLGWQEMDYLGMKLQEGLVFSTRAEPQNRHAKTGEFALLLNYTISANLYGVMLESIEQNLRETIRQDQGYSADWPAIDTDSPESFAQSTKQRQTLLREYTAHKAYLTPEGTIHGFLLYPSLQEAIENARRYRQVVATQRYELGKDVFAQTPIGYRHYRSTEQAEVRNDGRAYAFGEIISERSIQLEDPRRFDYKAGDGVTLIDAETPFSEGGTYFPNYVPYLK